MRQGGRRLPYRLTVRLATIAYPPFYARVILSRWNARGYVSPRARIVHTQANLGLHCYIDDDVLIYQDGGSGSVTLGDWVHLHRGNTIQTGAGGSVHIGGGTHMQQDCQISAYAGDVRIGTDVEVAPRCAFYPYNHGVSMDRPLRDQPLETRGGIKIGDRAWLGYGVVVLDGVRIGSDAVVGAGSVVTHSIPDRAIAAGNPARVFRSR